MKILALEKFSEDVEWNEFTEALNEEAREVYKLYHKGIIREIYFTQDEEAVLILECENLESADTILNTLPLVKKKMIGFEFKALNPYTGFSRIMI